MLSEGFRSSWAGHLHCQPVEDFLTGPVLDSTRATTSFVFKHHRLPTSAASGAIHEYYEAFGVAPNLAGWRSRYVDVLNRNI